MSVPERHHYLPEFYLKRWLKNGKLCEYRRRQNGLVAKPRSPRATGFEWNLYSLPGEDDPAMREQVESRIMHRVDTRAAAVLRYMIDHHGAQLSQTYSDAWILFVVSMIFRTPARLRWLNEQIRTADYAFDDDERAAYAELKSPTHPPTPEEYFALGDPEELSVARMKLMLRMIGSTLIGQSLASMVWEVHTLETLNHGLLTSDDPVMTSNGLNSGDSFVILPIGPRQLFIAANSHRAMWSFRSQTDRAVERAMNDAVVAQADQLVIGENDWQSLFVDRRLGQSKPSDGFLGRHTWKCP